LWKKKNANSFSWRRKKNSNYWSDVNQDFNQALNVGHSKILSAIEEEEAGNLKEERKDVKILHLRHVSMN